MDEKTAQNQGETLRFSACAEQQSKQLKGEWMEHKFDKDMQDENRKTENMEAGVRPGALSEEALEQAAGGASPCRCHFCGKVVTNYEIRPVSSSCGTFRYPVCLACIKKGWRGLH